MVEDNLATRCTSLAEQVQVIRPAVDLVVFLENTLTFGERDFAMATAQTAVMVNFTLYSKYFGIFDGLLTRFTFFSCF